MIKVFRVEEKEHFVPVSLVMETDDDLRELFNIVQETYINAEESNRGYAGKGYTQNTLVQLKEKLLKMVDWKKG